MSATARAEPIRGIVDTTRAKPARFRDERITMSHGAGGKATQSLIEGLLQPALENEAFAALGDAGAVSVEGDTKVVERGHADLMYACTTGLGVLDPRASLGPAGGPPGR